MSVFAKCLKSNSHTRLLKDSNVASPDLLLGFIHILLQAENLAKSFHQLYF